MYGQIQEELRAVRRRSDQPAGDRALPEIRQKMVCCKVLLVVGVGLRSVNRRPYFTGGNVTTEAAVASSPSLV